MIRRVMTLFLFLENFGEITKKKDIFARNNDYIALV